MDASSEKTDTNSWKKLLTDNIIIHTMGDKRYIDIVNAIFMNAYKYENNFLKNNKDIVQETMQLYSKCDIPIIIDEIEHIINIDIQHDRTIFIDYSNNCCRSNSSLKTIVNISVLNTIIPKGNFYHPYELESSIKRLLLGETIGHGEDIYLMNCLY